MKYAALLRGINIGGNTIKMQPLREALDKSGFEEVQTVLASGNIIFASELSKTLLEDRISKMIKKEFGLDISVIVVSKDRLEDIVTGSYFDKFNISKDIKAYISFASKAIPNNYYSNVSLRESGFTIVHIGGSFICSVVDHKNAGSPDLMKYLDKEFNKLITTRGLATIEKVLDKM